MRAWSWHLALGGYWKIFRGLKESPDITVRWKLVAAARSRRNRRGHLQSGGEGTTGDTHRFRRGERALLNRMAQSNQLEC